MKWKYIAEKMQSGEMTIFKHAVRLSDSNDSTGNICRVPSAEIAKMIVRDHNHVSQFIEVLKEVEIKNEDLHKQNQTLLEALKGILRQAVFSGLNYIFVLDIIDSAREAIAIAEEEPPQTESEQIKDCNKFMSKDSIYRCKNCGELVNEFDYYDRYREIGCPNCDCLEFMQISKTIQGDE